MSAHTPGPWIVYADIPSTDPEWHIVTTENKLRVLANVHIETGNAVDLANARLIAAAPELLEACKYFAADPMPDDWSIDEVGRRIRAAIAKAEGRA